MITKMNPISKSQAMSWRVEGPVVSACGRAFVTTAAPTAAARVRLANGTEVMGHVGQKLAIAGDVAYFPGTRAWSPPPC